MTLHRTARLLDAAMSETAFPRVARPVDVTDAARFPNIAQAIAEHAALPAERRAQLNAEWNAK